jgi:Na+/proline symporter
VTDNEFYELRYSGKPAALLRGFRAVYLGVVFNVIVMATVTLAAVKISNVLFGVSALTTIGIAGCVTVVFSALGGLTSVLVTDFVLFIVAMVGSVGAAVWIVAQPEIGGLSGLLQQAAVQEKTGTTEGLNVTMTLLILPLAVQWWAAWYPGAEPGGGGYVAQRMLAARNESHATGATLLFNAAHYALRPWPWIIVALASLVVYPDVASLQASFPKIDPDLVNNDLAYPAMLQKLPAGLLGLVAASLVAAYMSTISTHLNWGSSYVVNDVWKRFMRPTCSEKEMVYVGQAATVLLMLLAALLSLRFSQVEEGFGLLLKVGAGTGLIYLLRWFWWRINAMAEIVAMVLSFAVSAFFFFSKTSLHDWQQFLIVVGVTTLGWIAAVFLGPVESEATLRNFYRRIRPAGPGWKAVTDRARLEGQLVDCQSTGRLGREIFFALTGCVAIYGLLFSTGYLLYGQYRSGVISLTLSMVAALCLWLNWKKVASGE